MRKMTNSGLRIGRYHTPGTMASNLQNSPPLVAEHHEVHTIIKSIFTDERLKQKAKYTNKNHQEKNKKTPKRLSKELQSR